MWYIINNNNNNNNKLTCSGMQGGSTSNVLYKTPHQVQFVDKEMLP